MSPAWAIKILAACGVIIVGPLTSDALALARAIDVGSTNALLLFAQDHPSSPYAQQALRLSGGQSGQPVSSLVRTVSFNIDLPIALTDGRDSLVQKVQGREDGNIQFGSSRNKSPAGRNPAAARAAAQRAAADIETKLKAFQRDSQGCRGENFSAASDCVADALTKFARGLETVTRTPGGVAPVAIPAIRRAANSIRSARTKRQARAAIAAAIPVIRKSVELIVAGNDDQLYQMEVRQRSLTVRTLTIADQILVQATGI